MSQACAPDRETTLKIFPRLESVSDFKLLSKELPNTKVSGYVASSEVMVSREVCGSAAGCGGGGEEDGGGEGIAAGASFGWIRHRKVTL